jgi:O-antigen/teichoic acid export membrane protein
VGRPRSAGDPVATIMRRASAEESRPRGRHRARRPPAATRARRIGGDSVIRNSLSLIVNLLITSACSYGAFILVARLYSVKAVGLSATAISLGAFVVALTQLGTNYSLPRFLPLSNHRAAVINTALTTTLIAALIGGIIALVLPVADKLFALGGAFFALAFLVATCVQTGEAVLGTVLIADRSSGPMTRANTIPNLIRLVAPSAFTFMGALGSYVARFVSDIIAFFMFGGIIARRGHRFRLRIDLAATRDLRSFSFGMYVVGTLGRLPVVTLPIVTLERFGASQTAFWSVGITIATLLYQLPSMVGQALLPEAVQRPTERRRLLYRSALMTLGIVIPVLLVAYVAAPLGLKFFGAQYVAGSLGTLRWLIISGFITILNFPPSTILILAKKTISLSIIEAGTLVTVLILAITWARNGEDVAISWVAGDIVGTALVFACAYLASRQVGGHWEHLGDAVDDASRASGVRAAPTPESQRQALDVLLALSSLQEQRTVDDSSFFTHPRPAYSWAIPQPVDGRSAEASEEDRLAGRGFRGGYGEPDLDRGDAGDTHWQQRRMGLAGRKPRGDADRAGRSG